MNKKQTWIILFIIFVLTAGIRIYLAFQTEHFSEDNAYFTLRQVEQIQQTGTPLYHDDLSYGGRTYVFLPLFQYILTFFSLFMNISIVGKVIPNIFASTLVFIVYLIGYQMTKDNEVSILSAFISSFIPIFVSETINTISIYSITIPLNFLLFYFLMRIKSKQYLYYFLIGLCFYLILSPSSLILVFAMGLYYVYSWVEGFKPTRAEIEITVFSICFVIWFYVIFFKEALLFHGFFIFWKNIPISLINLYYSEFDLLKAIYLIGPIPFLACFIVFYTYTFKKKKKSVYLLISLFMIIILFLILRLIEIKLGLIYLGVISSILFGEYLIIGFKYFSKTKFVKIKKLLILNLFIFFIISSFIPSITTAKTKILESDPKEKVAAFKFLNQISNDNDLIVSSVFEGHLLAYYSKRKNFIDSNFLMVDSKSRLADLETIYKSSIDLRPIDIMEKYNADYIVETDKTKEYYNITKLLYGDSECFPLVYVGKGVKLYQRKCS